MRFLLLYGYDQALGSLFAKFKDGDEVTGLTVIRVHNTGTNKPWCMSCQ